MANLFTGSNRSDMVFPVKPGSMKRRHEDDSASTESTNGCDRDVSTEPSIPVVRKKRVFDFNAHPRRKIALQLLYHGWDFDGLVVQTNTENTVENHLMTALLKTKLIANEKECDYSRCGRTDKGVSAFKQVAAVVVRSADVSGKFIFWSVSADKSVVDSYPKKDELSYLKMLNGVLPKNIRVISWAAVPPDFSARHACTVRTYRYSMPRANLDVEVMRRAAAFLVGTHDFRNFCQVDMNEKRVNMSFVREIFEVSIEEIPSSSFGSSPHSDLLELTIKGSGFLWHMIRYIVTVIHEIGQGHEEPKLVSDLLDVQQTPCRPHYSLSVATPLCLHECRFDVTDLEWIYDEAVLKKVVTDLQANWADFQTKARIIENMLNGLKELPHGAELDTYKGLLEFTQDRTIPQSYVKFSDRKTCDSLEEKREKIKRKKDLNNSSTDIDHSFLPL